MNAARDRQMYADLGLFNPADDEAYFSNQGGVFFDPAIGEEVFRPYTAEEFEYLTTGQTGFKTGADSFVDYVGDGRVETGDGNRRTFYSDEGGFTDYRDITDSKAPVLTTTPDGKSAIYKDGKFITQGMPGFKDALAAALKLATGASAIKTGITGGKRGFSAPGNAAQYAMKELPQSAIRTAAAGGLMTYADGGSTFDPNAYLAINSDVAAAAAESGMTPEEFAQYHYNTWGATEGRNTGADLASTYSALQGGTEEDLSNFFVNTQYSPEQLAAYTGYGAEDLQRAMDAARQSATPQAQDDWMAGTQYDKSKLPAGFDWQKYIAVYKDLRDAGIDTQTEAERHAALFGSDRFKTPLDTQYAAMMQQQTYRPSMDNTFASASGKTDQAKQLWAQFGQDPAKLRQAAFDAGVTGGDFAALLGKPIEAVSSYMQQWLNPAITKYWSLDDWKPPTPFKQDPSGFVVGPGGGGGSQFVAGPGGSGGAIYNPGGQQLPSSAWPSAPSVLGQPYPFKPSDLYNSPQYANVGDPGVNPIVSSQSSMPMGGNAVTKPYEAIRSSSRLLEEGVRPGSAWNRGGGQVVYNPINAASGGLMGLQNQTNLGRYAGGGLGRLVQGPGDGVSDSVPAMIGGQQPALIAQGEYVLPARVVSELGNGSTEAGAQRIDQMVAKIEQMGKSAGRGKDSGAHQLLG
jgi:hypothetical protein